MDADVTTDADTTTDAERVNITAGSQHHYPLRERPSGDRYTSGVTWRLMRHHRWDARPRKSTNRGP
jgi:hypothetical protein